MKKSLLIVLLALFAAFALAACGSSSDDSAESDAPTRPPHEYWVWSDPGIAGGNFDADYADCKAQVESDPALGADVPKLAVVSAYMRCMTPKGWKFVNPDAPGQP